MTTWRLRLTRLKRKTSMAIIAAPGGLPSETSLGIMEGIAIMPRLNRPTRPDRTTKRPILGNWLQRKLVWGPGTW